MGEEEEDYMSDAFLKQLKDVRPGLCRETKKGRSRPTYGEQNPLPKHKKTKLAESEARQQALSTPLPSDNKGFSMLQRMGYKQGTGLGKSGDGRIAPVPIVVKTGRVGLGREGFVREKRIQKKLEAAQSVTVFRQQKQKQFSQKRVAIDLRRSQLACKQLDSEMGIFTADEEWFWPPDVQRTSNDEVEDEYDEEEDVLLEPSEQLAALTQYLRSKYFYCIWCGTAYEDDQDMGQHCPGDTEDVHE